MSISCRVITPVGTGHENIVAMAMESVERAKQRPGPFSKIEHRIVFGLPRSSARNAGMGGDWMFFLDADDEMMPDAFELVDLDSPATFGAICLEGEIARRNRYPCTWADIKEHGADGTLSMGFFYKGDMRFDESLDVGEDFDFYMRLPSFVKRKEPLVSIGYRTPSAHGPRGYGRTDWHGICRKIIDARLEVDGGR